MAYKHWTLDDLPWNQLDRSKANPDLVKVIKAAAMVEFNAPDYASYLCNVFADDPEFQQLARDWAVEEVQHGAALGKWASLVDPSFDFDAAFRRFRDGFRIQLDATASVRGSLSGELIARCMVETGTSSYYSAIGEATDEPLLKVICKKIATDEFRHYGLFIKQLRRYLAKERLGRWHRLRVALGRIAEAEDDELAYAYYAANVEGRPYDRETCTREYSRQAFRYYRPHHVDRGVAMIFNACGFRPQTFAHALAKRIAWRLIQKRTRLAAAG